MTDDIKSREILFLRTPEVKERLRPALAPGNNDKTMVAPITVERTTNVKATIEGQIKQRACNTHITEISLSISKNQIMRTNR
ncbi:hypothetical protein CAter282_2415 [Collimonas arenae]|uniref:Uncharacterized protein n=1 Tax=Collimonas arenae TaxID=279058 RepID=A0A127QJA1_9BURK|nr:hypothetical protein CAter10_2660 [Collimonas arenae]AMP10160.1 hypothetical protein CAter282_2415 [Collimonas arenae]